MENNKRPTKKVFDLVCGMEIDSEDIKHIAQHKDEAYHSCSDHCQEQFTANPANYAD